MSFINYDERGNQRGFNVNGIVGAVMIVLFFLALFFIARTIFNLVSLIAPILLLITLIIDYKVALNYGKFLLKLLKENTLMGIGAVVLTVLAYPVVAGFLFFKAAGKKFLMSKIKSNKKEEFQDYEEVEDEDFLDLPELEKSVETKSSNRNDGDSSNDYEQLFD